MIFFDYQIEAKIQSKIQRILIRLAFLLSNVVVIDSFIYSKD